MKTAHILAPPPSAKDACAGPATSPVAGGDNALALTVGQAAELLRFDPRTIRDMVRTGELEGNQRGHAIRISRTSALDWLRGKRRVPRSKR